MYEVERDYMAAAIYVSHTECPAVKQRCDKIRVRRKDRLQMEQRFARPGTHA